MIARIWNYLIDAINRPGEQLTRGQTMVRKSWQLAAFGWRQLNQHRAEGMAAELSYRTIFALVPLVVLALVTFRIVGGIDEVQSTVENQLYSFFGVPEIPDDGYVTAPPSDVVDVSAVKAIAPGDDTASELKTPEGIAAAAVENVLDGNMVGNSVDTVAAADPNTAEIKEAAQAKGAIQKTLRQVTAKVASIDFKSIGVIGLLLFIYAAIALADSVEQLFNRIFDAPKHRPVHIRLAIHWSILTLGSGLLTMSLYLSNQAVDWVGESGLGRTGQNITSHLLSILASWVLLFLLYALMPNTHVSVRAAGIGSFVGSLFWEAAKFGFAIYVNKALPYAALYGSIGLIPLFLFWIYVTWLIVLFGLILTQALQEYHGEVPTAADWSDERLPKGDPDWMVPIMMEITHQFNSGVAVNHQDLGDALGLSSRIVHDMVSRLIAGNFVRRVGVGAGDDEGLSLARPADRITIAEILQLAHAAKPSDAHPAWQTLEQLKQAERLAAGTQTLADISAASTG